MGTPGCRSFLHASFEPHHGGSLDGRHLDRKPTRRRQAVHEPTRRATETLRTTRNATINSQPGRSACELTYAVTPKGVTTLIDIWRDNCLVQRTGFLDGVEPEPRGRE